MLARGGAATLSLAVIVAVGIAAVTALRGRMAITTGNVTPTSSPPAETPTDSAISDSIAAPTSESQAMMAATGVAPRNAVPDTATSVAAGTPPAAKSVSLVVPVGRTELRDTMVAERASDTVRVSFDLILSRTRRPDKFEWIVRSTLPQVYGSAVDSALRVLPFGVVERAGDLVTTLPERGFQIPLAGGRTIGVWPVTRAGRDGPLVVAYRAVATR
jgi:hypothetical protein